MLTPYTASKISLITKSQIRYEGFLYTVDPKESTITLGKARSFGTEGRPTAHPVPPRYEIYEGIIFKVCGVTKLVVCEPPQPVPWLCTGLYSPAIATVSEEEQPNSQLPATSAPGASVSGSGTSSRLPTPLRRVVRNAVITGIQTGPQNRASGTGRQAIAARGGRKIGRGGEQRVKDDDGKAIEHEVKSKTTRMKAIPIPRRAKIRTRSGKLL